MLRVGRSESGPVKTPESGNDVIVLKIQEVSSDRSLLGDTELSSESKTKTAVSVPRQTKVLFLDGVRGLAAMLVALQHSKEYLNDVNVGASAVDTFFVLSSFLLTMLFLEKSEKLLAQGASYRKWWFALADYFLKRFFRVYPFFVLVAVVIRLLPFEYQNRYFLVETADKYDLYKVLTFDFDHRYLMLWTLPLEIAYYFFIPMFVLAVLRSQRLWWVAYIPLQMWVVYEGFYTYRSHHILLRPHFTTFLQGSLAAVVFVKLDAWLKTTGFEFCKWQILVIRAVEYLLIAMLISECFRTVLYEWVHDKLVPVPPGDPFISLLVASIIVVEMVMPSSVSRVLEWNVLRHWGKISFSVYLLHPFVIFSDVISQKTNYYDRFFSQVFLLLVLTTTSYYLVECPLQLAIRRISRALTELESKGCGVSVQIFANSNIVKTIYDAADCSKNPVIRKMSIV